jgi:hypothetical protein
VFAHLSEESDNQGVKSIPASSVSLFDYMLQNLIWNAVGIVRIRYVARNIVQETGFKPAYACATGPSTQFDCQSIEIHGTAGLSEDPIRALSASNLHIAGNRRPTKKILNDLAKSRPGNATRQDVDP